MDILLYLTLENSCARRFVEACGLQNMCRVDPIVLSPSHNMFLEVITELIFIHRDSTISGTIYARPGGDSRRGFHHYQGRLLSDGEGVYRDISGCIASSRKRAQEAQQKQEV